MPSQWYSSAASSTPAWYHTAEGASFHRTLLRAFAAMQQYQRCQELALNPTYFPVPPARELRVFMCRTADNMNPRLTVQDRELVLRRATTRLLGVDPAVHGGLWLSGPLVFSFLVGLTDAAVPLKEYVCKKSYLGQCPGRKTICIPKDLKVEPPDD